MFYDYRLSASVCDQPEAGLSYKLDLHTHSYGSRDGSLQVKDYRFFLQNGLLDHIAITDHNCIETALTIQKELAELGKRIIVGEEIMTTQGELVGLFLSKLIPAGLTPLETSRLIHAQGGLVYVPHAFETVRSGLSAPALNEIAQDIDIVETFNGRAVFQNRSKVASLWAKQNARSAAASSDAHGRFGWGYTYSVVEAVPDHENLPRLLSAATYSKQYVGWGILYPKFNRLKWALKR